MRVGARQVISPSQMHRVSNKPTEPTTPHEEAPHGRRTLTNERHPPPQVEPPTLRSVNLSKPAPGGNGSSKRGWLEVGPGYAATDPATASTPLLSCGEGPNPRWRGVVQPEGNTSSPHPAKPVRTGGAAKVSRRVDRLSGAETCQLYGKKRVLSTTSTQVWRQLSDSRADLPTQVPDLVPLEFVLPNPGLEPPTPGEVGSRPPTSTSRTYNRDTCGRWRRTEPLASTRRRAKDGSLNNLVRLAGGLAPRDRDRVSAAGVAARPRTEVRASGTSPRDKSKAEPVGSTRTGRICEKARTPASRATPEPKARIIGPARARNAHSRVNSRTTGPRASLRLTEKKGRRRRKRRRFGFVLNCVSLLACACLCSVASLIA